MPASILPAPDRPSGRRALVLFSGGQDSTTCLFWALEHFETVAALGFDYGQRHRVELEQAAEIAHQAGVPFEVVDVRGTLRGSALTEPGKATSDPHERAPDLPAAFVPGRNALFLALAASRAFLRADPGAGLDLVGGMCQADFSGYPDCRLGFIQAQEKALGLALDRPLRIHTPLMDLTKAETWKAAKDLGTVRGIDVLHAVREMSHTDYHGDRSERHAWGYGKLDNPASVLRAKGYAEAEANGWV
jgi:7-cyano-7-deazaguanine synthase